MVLPNPRFNALVRCIGRINCPDGYDLTGVRGLSLATLTAHYKRAGRPLIWDGASKRTIFGNPEVNYWFRAWHDYHHIKLQAPFDEEGERAVFEAQVADLREGYCLTHGHEEEFIRILEAEIIGQGLYAKRHGHFPADQRGFVWGYLLDPNGALGQDWH